MKVVKEISKYGRMLWESGLIHLTSGNISVRKGSVIYITRTGSLLGALAVSDIVSVNLENNRSDAGASSETPVHRALYHAHPDISSVVHAHPPYATTLSWDYNLIKTKDSDSLYIPEIPVLVDCSYSEGSRVVAQRLPKLMGTHKVAMIRGHGAFSVGKDVREATARLSMMENQCRLLFFRRLLENKS